MSLLIGTGLTAVWPTQPAIAQESRAQAFDIPAQPLSSALLEFAEQTGMEVLFDTRIAEGRTSAGLEGSYTPEQALRVLLAGTGVEYRLTAANTVTLERALPGKKDDLMQLGPITVLGSRGIDVPLSNVPSSITVVNREEIEKEQATSNRIEDILSRRVPGFNPADGTRIRGRRVQQFINGVPVAELVRDSFRDGLSFVAPDQLANVEVSRGANSAYGFGSSGGIIAQQTPRAESEELTLRTTVRESFNPHRVGGSHQASLYQSVSQIVGKFDYHVGGVIAYDGKEFDPDGNLALGLDNAALNNNSEEVLGNVDGSFGLDLGGAGRLRLTGTFSHVNFRETFQLVPGVYREQFGSFVPQPGGGDSFREVYTVNFSYESPDILGNAVKLELFTSDSQIQTHRTVSNRTVRDEQTNEYQGFRSSITSPLDVLYDRMSITYGFD